MRAAATMTWTWPSLARKSGSGRSATPSSVTGGRGSPTDKSQGESSLFLSHIHIFSAIRDAHVFWWIHLNSLCRFTRTYAHHICLCSMQGDIQFLLSYWSINYLLINDNRGEATQLRNTDPRNAWPCWIDGHHQLASSDEFFDCLEGSPANPAALGLKYRF
jgi:hypothetical protein